MADWIHLDKTSGTGPAEVKVTADINETGEIRQVTYKVIKEDTKEEKTFVCRQESVPVVIIPEFDYLVLRYIWADEDGIDFDTATGLITPVSRTLTASWLVGVNSIRPRRNG